MPSVCPFCKEEVEARFKLCPYCGEELPKCKECGEILDPKFKMCPYCGSSAQEEPDEGKKTAFSGDSVIRNSEINIDQSQTVTHYAESDPKVKKMATVEAERCPICFGVVKDDYFKCPKCKRDFIHEKHQEETPEYYKTHRYVCIDCLEEIEAEHAEVEKKRKAAEAKKKAEEEAERERKAETERIRLKKEAEAEKKRREEEESKQQQTPGSLIDGPLPGMQFAYIPGGSFMMGSEDYPDRQPVHKVTLKPFRMQNTPVTQKQWVEVMGDNPSYFNGGNLPVEQVSWNDCQEFIKKLNSQYPCKEYRLPSEAEWEYACRAGTTTKYYSGNSKSDLGRVGWYTGNSGSKTHPVGQKSPNAWGLYDMHGNVWEWCQDWKGDYPSGSFTDPQGPSSGTRRVLRGGSWYDYAYDCRSAYRGSFGPSDTYYGIGFRIVFSP